MDYDFYMKRCLELAQIAKEYDETPIGCVVVFEDKIIGEGYNLRNTNKNVIYHAEMTAITEACNYMGDWRLEDSTIFVTLEPCAMCAGAILQSRIKRLVYGAKSHKAGCCGSIINLLNNDEFNHKVEIVDGVMEKECSKIISDYFIEMRARKNNNC